MGLDCYVYTSKCTKEEIETAWEIYNESEDASYADRPDLTEEIWYGRKTHQIMNLLLEDYRGEDNCEYIPIDKDRIDGFKELFKREVILPNMFDEYELNCFKELLDALENVEEDVYIYFYAWY